MDVETSDNFYVVLPSNVRTHVENSTKNTTSHYRTYLPRALEVNPRQWEVALAEINFPQSWAETVKVKNCWFRFFVSTQDGEFLRLEKLTREGKISDDWRNNWFKKGFLPVPNFMTCKTDKEQEEFEEEYYLDDDLEDYTAPSDYNGLESLIIMLNKRKPKEMIGNFKITSKGYVVVELRKRETIHFHEHLAQLLGFDYWKICGRDSCGIIRYDRVTNIVDNANDLMDDTLYDIRAKHKPDMRITGYNLFIYCNLVTETFVGDRLVKLLRTVPVNPEENGKYISRTFQKLRYLPFSGSLFEHVEIMIADDVGDQIRFEWGKVIVTLHVRRKAN